MAFSFASVLLFLAVLFVLVLVHEWGHYITAKWTGMKVEEFGIGFPPRAFSWMRGETRWSLNWLPIGGFVKILGENGTPEDGVELPEADRARAFGARPKWAQAIVLLAGVTMNMLLAWVLIIGTHVAGVPTPILEEEAGPSADLAVQYVLPEGPAAAVLQPGVTITSVTAGEQTLEELRPSSLTDFVASVAPEPITITYLAGSKEGITEITPVAGLNADNPDQYLIGILPVMIEDQSVGLLSAIQVGTTETWSRTVFIAQSLWELLRSSVAGTADYSQVAGPIGIAAMTDEVAMLGVISVMQFMAMLSISLAIINLVPIPALDGGRLVFVAIEAITGRPIPPMLAGRMIVIGFALLMLLMIAVTYNDIVRLIS